MNARAVCESYLRAARGRDRVCLRLRRYAVTRGFFGWWDRQIGVEWKMHVLVGM